MTAMKEIVWRNQNEDTVRELRSELIQVAAVCYAIVDQLDEEQIERGNR